MGVNGVPEDLLVPLAHQSVLADMILAIQLLAAAELALAAARPPEIEGRFDVFRGLSQAPAAPRAQLVGCICSDLDFVDAYRRAAEVSAEAA